MQYKTFSLNKLCQGLPAESILNTKSFQKTQIVYFTRLSMVPGRSVFSQKSRQKFHVRINTDMTNNQNVYFHHFIISTIIGNFDGFASVYLDYFQVIMDAFTDFLSTVYTG